MERGRRYASQIAPWGQRFKSYESETGGSKRRSYAISPLAPIHSNSTYIYLTMLPAPKAAMAHTISSFSIWDSIIKVKAIAHTRGIMKNNNKVVNKKTLMNPKDDKARAYMLVEIQPGKEKEFGDEILSRGLLIDSKVERMDFVHGPFDFVIIVHGEMEDIDAKLMEIRKSAFVRKTSTLICFEMFDLVDISDRVKEQS
ncbi:hypothetical protein MUP77_10805 [Candidatus Bathyarchaeota archaeon]|nr:hypothetical protein [Candidatus Bathyarchaeota archaeon]